MKSIKVFVFLLFAPVFLFGQKDITAKEVIESYLKAIGGRNKLEQVESIIKEGEQIIRGEKHLLVEKVINNTSFLLERSFSKGDLKAILSNGKGVNITDDGVFSMPPDQYVRYEKDTRIFPELFYLEEGYSLNYNGLYELDDTTKCYEIEVRGPDSSLIYKEYNVKSGLLEMIVKGREKTRIIEYKAIDGILFPHQLLINGLNYTSKKIQINAKINRNEFIWNSEEEEQFIGRWEAIQGENEAGQQQIFFIELFADRGGKEGFELVVNGERKEANFLRQRIVGWDLEEDKIRLKYYDAQAKQLWFKYFILKDYKSDRIVGYISDPEMDEKFGNELQAVELEFKKVKE